jgi:trimethylamine:corrinoid methyltransferase-like protein
MIGAVAALLLSAASRGGAQGVGIGDGRAYHALVLSSGMSTMSVDALNARMSTSRFAPLSNDAVSLGAAAHVAIGRALLGAELGRAAFGEEGLDNGRTDELSAVQGLATVGYAVVATEHLSVFPQLGAGVGRVTVSLRDRSGTSTTQAQPTFDEVAQAPGTESRLAGRHLLYSVGAGADYLVTRPGGSLGVVVGLRGGRLLSPPRTRWRRVGARVVAGPDAAASGPFLRVVVGVGGR